MKFTAIILAAGKGTRLKSQQPKPLHMLCGKPLVNWVIESAQTAGAEKTIIVTGQDRDMFEGQLSGTPLLVTQHPAQGTGHAVASCLDHIKQLADDSAVLILYADTPLIQTQTLEKMVSALGPETPLVVAGFHHHNPFGYGRLVVKSQRLQAIIEEKDASPEQKQINLVNGGFMAAHAGLLKQLLPLLDNNNAQKEYYLTDLVKLASQHKMNASFIIAEADELAGVNDRQQLAQLETAMQARLRKKALLDGVTMIDPETVYLSADTEIAADVCIEPHVVIGPDVKIESGAIIKSFSHIEGTHIGPDCIIGPFARLRSGTRLVSGVKIGNFVETKNAIFDEGAKANHLSYLGDANIGKKANIGAGTITCNYDGFNKHQTIIGDYAFIGSNSALVAPVTIGPHALVGAGSTICKDIESHALAVSRAPQKAIADGAARQREKAQALQENRKKTDD